MKILIKRTGALGDVILTLPIAQWFHVKHNAEIDFLTHNTNNDIFENNFYIKVINNQEFTLNRRANKYHKIIDLDMAYEKRPKMHIIKAYAEEAGINIVELEQPKIITKSIKQDSIVKSFDIVLHAARTWRNRTFPSYMWDKLLKKTFGNIAIIGHVFDYPSIFFDESNPNKFFDYRGKLSIHQMKDLIENSNCFIGSDSGIMHLASTTQTPIVGIFTCAKAEYRYPFRSPRKFQPVEAPIDCYGCLQELPPPQSYCECPKNRKYQCTSLITEDMIYSAYKKAIDENNK